MRALGILILILTSESVYFLSDTSLQSGFVTIEFQRDTLYSVLISVQIRYRLGFPYGIL